MKERSAKKPVNLKRVLEKLIAEFGNVAVDEALADIRDMQHYWEEQSRLRERRRIEEEEHRQKGDLPIADLSLELPVRTFHMLHRYGVYYASDVIRLTEYGPSNLLDIPNLGPKNYKILRTVLEKHGITIPDI